MSSLNAEVQGCRLTKLSISSPQDQPAKVSYLLEGPVCSPAAPGFWASPPPYLCNTPKVVLSPVSPPASHRTQDLHVTSLSQFTSG